MRMAIKSSHNPFNICETLSLLNEIEQTYQEDMDDAGSNAFRSKLFKQDREIGINI